VVSGSSIEHQPSGALASDGTLRQFIIHFREGTRASTVGSHLQKGRTGQSCSALDDQPCGSADGAAAVEVVQSIPNLIRVLPQPTDRGRQFDALPQERLPFAELLARALNAGTNPVDSRDASPADDEEDAEISGLLTSSYVSVSSVKPKSTAQKGPRVESAGRGRPRMPSPEPVLCSTPA